MSAAMSMNPSARATSGGGGPIAVATRRAAARAAAAQVEGQLRDRIVHRVDQLVQGMEGVAERLHADNVTSARRSVLVSRFNELQRQVNRIDGIVGGEGREASGQAAAAGVPPATARAAGETGAADSSTVPAAEPPAASEPAPANRLKSAGQRLDIQA